MGKYESILKVVEYGTIGRAAAAMGYTPSSLSYLINSIEQEFGVKLFHRDRQGSRLTEAGTDLLPLIQQIEELDAALHYPANLHQSDVLRVGITSSVSTEWLPGIMDTFRKKYENISIHLFQEDTYTPLAAAVEVGKLDCAFYAGEHPSTLDFFPLYEDAYHVVVKKGHPLAEKQALEKEDLLGCPFISPNELSGPGPLSELAKQFSLSGQFFLGDMEDLPTVSMVEQGFGFSIMPSLLLRDVAKNRNVVEIPLSPPITRTLGLLCRTYHTTKPAARSFIQISKKYVEDWLQEQEQKNHD